MKRFITCMIILLSSVSYSFSQTTILYDGETIVPDFWDIGGGYNTNYNQGPNGTDCKENEGWKLYVSGKMDLMTEGYSNPLVNSTNSTDKVVRFIRAKNGEGWAGALLNVATLNLNIATTTKFSVLIKKPIEGVVSMKLEGAGSQEVSANYTTPGQWQKLEFSFTPSNFTGAPTSLLIFPHNQGGLTENIITYWDEITTYDSSNNPTVIYNGNDPIGSLTVPGFFLDGYWGPNGDLNNLEIDAFPNLFAEGQNNSNHVIRFLRAKDGRSWCGMGLGGLNIDVAATPTLTLMINKSVIGKVGVKLEGAGSQELYSNYTTPNQWAKLVFNFDSKQFSGKPTTLIVFPHFEDTDLAGQNLTSHIPMYIDNISIESPSTSIGIKAIDKQISSIKYYTLAGVLITDKYFELKNGSYIKQIYYENGDVEQTKIILTNRK